jgi:predicted phosphodiesterase
MREADNHLKRWFKAFPSLFLCRGNHDALVDRKSRTAGLPERVFKPFRDIWGLPNGWIDDFTFEIDNVRYIHGTGLSGDYAHIKAAVNNRQSCVIGHTHHSLCTDYLVSEKDRIFAVNCGCGIDRHSYAMRYGKDFVKKPALGCAVITDQGKLCQVFPMEL